jgi:hypothetical protein
MRRLGRCGRRPQFGFAPPARRERHARRFGGGRRQQRLDRLIARAHGMRDRAQAELVGNETQLPHSGGKTNDQEAAHKRHHAADHEGCAEAELLDGNGVADHHRPHRGDRQAKHEQRDMHAPRLLPPIFRTAGDVVKSEPNAGPPATRNSMPHRLAPVRDRATPAVARPSRSA